jgi:hypothetical protein
MSPKTPSPMIATLLILGGIVFGVLARVYQPDMQKLLPSRCWSGDERLQDV